FDQSPAKIGVAGANAVAPILYSTSCTPLSASSAAPASGSGTPETGPETVSPSEGVVTLTNGGVVSGAAGAAVKETGMSTDLVAVFPFASVTRAVIVSGIDPAAAAEMVSVKFHVDQSPGLSGAAGAYGFPPVCTSTVFIWTPGS